MPSVTKYTATGSKSGTAQLDADTFGIEPNMSVMHQIVTNQLATRRAGTQSTKTRTEVRGGGAKPFRQKGTGNARQGSIRAPHYIGGGVALGPKPRSYAKKAPKKMVKLALRSALSDRAAGDRVIVLESWSFDQPSTKAANALLEAAGIEGTVLVVIDRENANAIRSFRNLPHVTIVEPAELNAYDVLANEYVVFAEADLPTAAAPASAADTSSTENASTDADDDESDES